MDEECGHGDMRVVPVQEPDQGTLAEALPKVEDATEDPVGRGTKGDWEREESIHGPRPVCGRAIHPIDFGLFADYESGSQGGAERAATGVRGGGRAEGEGGRDGIVG